MNAIRRILSRTSNTARTYTALVTQKKVSAAEVPPYIVKGGIFNTIQPSRAPLIEFHDLEPSQESFKEHVVNGLSKKVKAVSCKFLYDKRGSELFDAICSVPEYYQTRTEIGILEKSAPEIASLMGDNIQLIELGSGASHKISVLLELMKKQGVHYIPIDISNEFLRSCAEDFASSHPSIQVSAICADYTSEFKLPSSISNSDRKKVAFFPGSTIGNLTPIEALNLLSEWNAILGSKGEFLIGVDLKKENRLLNAAYNDKQGISAAFNLNLLHRINRELGADFDLTKFKHNAFYNKREGRIEIYITSTANQTVRMGQHKFFFRAGEDIHTEYSYKYTVGEFYLLARMAGFNPVKTWVDEDKLFSVHYLKCA
jgi:dimethylhistidine N-methyltransferase